MKRWITLFSIIVLLVGCSNDEKTMRINKEKYDNAINQVIKLENKRLQHENILSVDKVLLREDLGVDVYSEGHYIKLYYNIDSQDWPRIEKIYERIAEKKYMLISDEEAHKDENQKYFEKFSYSERVPLK